MRALNIAANSPGRVSGNGAVDCDGSLDCDWTLSSSVNKPELFSGQTSHTVLEWLLPKLYTEMSTGSTGLTSTCHFVF